MDELYTQTELIRGRWYRYDPDHDLWYPVDRYTSMTIWEMWAPLIVIVSMLVLAIWLEYFQ
jgi:hypothetical protein